GVTSITAYRSALDCTLGFDITWAPYSQHRGVRPLHDVCFYFGWLRCGNSISLHLLERVLRQFGYTHTIPRLPTQSADPLATRDNISAQFIEYLDRVLTPEQRELAAIYSWYAAPGYMR
ncbi:serine/threonine-protein phosphatase 7 long form-like protein, partial [Trifolium medium]|nr:serine/threonine-protein phosphatase 7 long form-like protein [Trifolium medium]